MSNFTMGQVVTLKSDNNITGAVIDIIEGIPENRYRVFTKDYGVQVYYASQLKEGIGYTELENVDAERFHANLTSSLIRNPTLSSLYSLNTAKIDFIPHQFRPVLKFIHSDRPRLLIADSVGVGKTIEAGLILRELQARRDINSVLIICPKPLVAEQKWEMEMRRFDEEFTSINGEEFRYCIHELDMEGEWPDKYKMSILPYSLFDEKNIYGSKAGRNRSLGLMDVDPPKFDLLIVDEAHHIRNTATYSYKAVSRFIDNAEAVLFLTATPVQLEYDDLFVLLNLLRPDLVIDKNTFYDMAEPNEYINKASMLIRNQKDNWQEKSLDEVNNACYTDWGKKVFFDNPKVKEIRESLDQENISVSERVDLITEVENLHTFSNVINRTRRRDIGEFTIRKSVTVIANFTTKQRILHDEVLNVINDILSIVHFTDNTKFMMTTIRRQTASCLFGLIPMLKEILNRHVPNLYGYDMYDDYMYDDRNESTSIFGEEKNVTQIKRRIEDILKMAEKLPKDDPKLDKMLSIVEAKQHEEKNKIMIFSSFRHTLNYLYQNLIDKNIRIGMIHGGVPDEERRQLRQRFNSDQTPKDSEEALDILLLSEVGTEGLDFQFCDCMINYDLPWNPMRIEQRIGRIDRNGQTSESVSIYNMIIPGTVDADIYERCFLRIGVFQQSIGDCEEILGEVTSELHKIVGNFDITEEDRKERIQQMTDNKIRLIKERQGLEDKQKDLFGLRVPKDNFKKELEDATNHWLTAESIRKLVNCYLKNRLLTDQEYILGEKSLKTLRLSETARLTIYNDLKQLDLKRNETNRRWEKWLKYGDQHITITFDSESSKENPKVQLVSITHPLVKQAANFFKGNNKIVTGLKINTKLFRPGEYPFAIYQWRLSGIREDLQLQPVASNRELNKLLFDLIKDAVDTDHDITLSRDMLEKIEYIHHEIWEDALVEHRSKTYETIKYKEASLKTSHAARIATLEDQLKQSEDQRYINMTQGKIKHASNDFEYHMNELQEAKGRIDIFFDLLAYGVLIIEGKD